MLDKTQEWELQIGECQRKNHAAPPIMASAEIPAATSLLRMIDPPTPGPLLPPQGGRREAEEGRQRGATGELRLSTFLSSQAGRPLTRPAVTRVGHSIAAD